MGKEKLKVTEGLCPYCGSDFIDRDKTTTEEAITIKYCYCRDCKREFNQVYNQQEFVGQDVGEYLDICLLPNEEVPENAMYDVK